MKENVMNRNKELEKMMKAAGVLDVLVSICGIIVQIMCGLGAVALLAMHFLAFIPTDDVRMDLRVLGRNVAFESISPTGQTFIILLMAAVCVVAILMTRDLVKALHKVFRPMAAGRPFEEEAVNGFKRAAIWCVVIAVLSMNGYVLVIAALLILLSYVFHYGAILQTESDETL